MGQMTNGKPKKVKDEIEDDDEEEEIKASEEQDQEQDGLSVHSPCKLTNSSLIKEKSDVELELRLLEALETYPPAKLRGPHRHFVLFGLADYMHRSFNRAFAVEEVVKLLDRFYNLEMVKPEDEDGEFLTDEEDFRLPQWYFATEES